MAISVAQVASDGDGGGGGSGNKLKLLSIRTIDPPSRMFASVDGVGAGAGAGGGEAGGLDEGGNGGNGIGIWKKKTGGMKRDLVARMIKMVMEEGGVGEDVYGGLEGWS